MSVKNKVVVITGAASGLGLGMANEFAKQGAKVVIADLDLQKTQIVANELANNSAASKFLTPIFKIVDITLTPAAKNSAISFCSYKKPAVVVKLINEKNI